MPYSFLSVINTAGIFSKSVRQVDYSDLTNPPDTLDWVEITGATAGIIGKGYIANNVSQVVVTLPSSASVGNVIAITGKGAGGWRIAQNAGQTIHMGPFSTVTGITGYIESIHYLDGVTLLCITANTDWKVVWSVGDLNINVS